MTVSLAKLLPYATDGERRVAGRLVDAALGAGCTVSVNDGEETTVRQSTDRTTILGALGTTGEDNVTIYNGASGTRAAVFVLIWGNNPTGEELIADSSDNAVAAEFERVAYGPLA